MFGTWWIWYRWQQSRTTCSFWGPPLSRDWEGADIYGLKGERVFVIAHPLSSMDKLDNNCHFKKAENVLSFKHLHRVRNKPSQKCRCSLILETPVKEPPTRTRIDIFRHNPCWVVSLKLSFQSLVLDGQPQTQVGIPGQIWSGTWKLCGFWEALTSS